MEYIVVMTEDLKYLVYKVNAHLSIGYTCLGGLVINKDIFCQSMLKN